MLILVNDIIFYRESMLCSFHIDLTIVADPVLCTARSIGLRLVGVRGRAASLHPHQLRVWGVLYNLASWVRARGGKDGF